jgi:hypothetical protein
LKSYRLISKGLIPQGLLRRIVLIPAMLLYFCASCIFDAQKNGGALTMTCINGITDTLSVFPQLQFVFSGPLIDSSVSLNFSPPVGRYAVFLNATHDTLSLNVMDMLAGNTRYVLRLGNQITSKDGATLLPSQDSLSFITYPREQEPNDTKDLADDFASKIFGTISDQSDIDVFLCNNNSTHGIFLQSINSQDSLYVVDGLSHAFSLDHPINPIDTIIFPDSLVRPFYVFVVSRIMGSEGDYELGIVSK